MDIFDDMGVIKLSAKVFSKVNYSFKVLHLFGSLNAAVSNSTSTEKSPNYIFFCPFWLGRFTIYSHVKIIQITYIHEGG